MPLRDLNGVSAAQEIWRIAPATKIVFLTVHDTPAAKIGTKLWAHGFVTKSDAGTELIPTLKRVAGIPNDSPKSQAATDCRFKRKEKLQDS